MTREQKYKYFYRGLITIALAVAFLVIGAHFSRTSTFDVRWPAHSPSHTMLLRPASSPESIRLVDYAADQLTITGMRIEYRDGSTALVTYDRGRPVAVRSFFAEPATAGAGAVATVSTLRKLSDGLAARKLKSVIEFKRDGLTIKSMVSYHNDGSIESVGVRDGADDYSVTVYGDSGVSGIARIAVYDGTSGALKSEQVFRADGTVASSFVSTSSGYSTEAKQTFFDASGTRTSEIVFDGTYDISINEYAADGKTLKQKTAFGYSSTVVTSYDAAGTNPVIERTFIDDTHISVRYFGADGKATLQQRWVKVDSNLTPGQIGVTSDGFYLTEAYEFHADGVSVKNDVSFYPGGKVVSTFENRPTIDWRPRTIKHYREDGTLDSTDECSASSYTCNTVKAVAAAASERAHVPAHFFKVVPLLPAPAATKPQVPTVNLTFDLR
ncbi:MAG: hypothetical protein KGS72_14855 [Cyanobacteria bacterium REEB67]|nr:hypothetical protein [Cyanobacteria bacterium REEB67]